jgi:hypothetical protein
MDDELKQKFAELDAAIDELFALFGRMSPRQAALRPSYLKDAGENSCEIVGGHIVVKAAKVVS